ncbi:MAG: response regulator transcription factor, partial [Dehalococcoidales bacterium]|nr:response regulator transcription factor [Dehalococcoidales bacterium]
MEENKIKVLVIDDQPLFRTGVRQALSQQPNLNITDCDPREDPIGLIETSLPDIALLGSDLANVSGLELGRKITRYFPNTKVIVLSSNPNDE